MTLEPKSATVSNSSQPTALLLAFAIARLRIDKSAASNQQPLKQPITTHYHPTLVQGAFACDSELLAVLRKSGGKPRPKKIMVHNTS